MTHDILYGLVLFAFVSSITPGPNNIMLMASGANYGIRRTLPHMLGVSLGHGFLVFLLGLGLLEVFDRFPKTRLVLTIVCGIYLVWLAWKIANSSAPQEAHAEGKPLTFLQAAAFQWVNPKAVYMGITAQTAYAPEGSGVWPAAIVALTFISVNLPSVSLWAWTGTRIRAVLANPVRLRAFNWTMAGLLLLTLVPILRSTFAA